MKNMISKSIFVMALFLSVCIYGQVPPAERAALIAFYEGTSPELWTNTNNWGTNTPVSDWYGVTVSEGRVTELRLRENRLRGSIPPELWTLTGLTHLDLFRNNLEGTISSEIGNLSNLRVLKIGGNFLNGLIPPELWTLTELTELSFTGISTRRTALQGPIPAELGNLTNLTILSLSYTHSLFLEAGLPDEIGQLQSLRRLYLRNSSLSGEIPSVLGTLNNLEHLNFRLNNLSGAIPAGIATLPNLEVFNVSGNRLDFADLEPTFNEFQEKEDFIFDYLPQSVGRVDVERTELVTEGEPTILSVSEEFIQSENNRFQWYNSEGIIEGAAGASYTAGNAGTYHYRITNTIVTGLTLRSHEIELSSLERTALMAIYNATGGSDWENQENWSTDTPLAEWEGIDVNEEGHVINIVINNTLVGDLPVELGNLEYLQILDLRNSIGNRESQISLPENIGDLESLRSLILINNGLSLLPETIGALRNLEYLDLTYNTNLTFLPESFGGMTNLKSVSLNDNSLTSLPEDFENLISLEYLELSRNKFISFPESVVELNNLERLDLGGNDIHSVPENVSNLENLRTLNLSDNGITSFPEGVINIRNLERLFLSDNELTFIPESIENMENIDILGLDNNYLESLSIGIRNMESLRELDVSHNYLHFDDLESYKRFFISINDFSPQYRVGEEEFITAGGGPVTLRSGLASRRYTNYKWFKDGVEIDGARGFSYIIENVNETDEGIYHYEATDLIVTELTLRSNNIHLTYSPRGGSSTMGRVTLTQESSFNFMKEPSSSILFPNPANIGSDVTITGIHAEDVNIIILNTAGISISKIDAVQIRNDEYTFNTSNLSSGIYIVKIINKEDGTAITKRIIINSSE